MRTHQKSFSFRGSWMGSNREACRCGRRAVSEPRSRVNSEARAAAGRRFNSTQKDTIALAGRPASTVLVDALTNSRDVKALVFSQRTGVTSRISCFANSNWVTLIVAEVRTILARIGNPEMWKGRLLLGSFSAPSLHRGQQRDLEGRAVCSRRRGDEE